MPFFFVNSKGCPFLLAGIALYHGEGWQLNRSLDFIPTHSLSQVVSSSAQSVQLWLMVLPGHGLPESACAKIALHSHTSPTPHHTHPPQQLCPPGHPAKLLCFPGEWFLWSYPQPLPWAPLPQIWFYFTHSFGCQILACDTVSGPHLFY